MPWDTLARRAVPALSLCLLCTVTVACGNEAAPQPDPDPVTQDLSCAGMPDPLCAHPINQIVVPLVRELGLTPQEAPRGEICRRLFVDLMGRIPTPSELTVCVGQTQEAAVDALMATPDYERVQHGFWARILRYQVATTIFWQIFELDALVGQLIDGEIRYDAFAGEAVIHPAFFASRLDAGWGPGVFETFLGRAPRPDEMDGLTPLARMFSARLVCDGGMVDNLYRYCLAYPDLFEAPCERTCVFFNLEGALNECGCTPFEQPFDASGSSYGCTGDGLGESIDLGATSCFAFELSRLSEYSGGDEDRCPGEELPCEDSLYIYEEDGSYTIEPAMPLPPASEGLVEDLHRIGDVLAARGDFWEAAVDRELTRYLGWWKSGFNQPDFDLPSVRALLAALLEDTGDLRDVQRSILTSLLYTAPVALLAPAAEGDESDGEVPAELPPWASGPLKLLSGEAWLDSASAVVGEVLGSCDSRFIDPDSNNADIIAFLADKVEELESTLDFTSWLVELGLPDDVLEQVYVYLADLTGYRNLARGLGGCRSDLAPRNPSLSLVGQESDSASVLCAFGREAVPERLDPDDQSEATLQRIATHLWERALSRQPSEEELTPLVEELQACLDEGSCTDSAVASRWLCARLLDSSLFGVY